jgi:adenylosuccinate synthase
LKAHLANGSALVGEYLEADKTVLCEGAQGALLDIDHGTYPFVTSSSTIAGGALTGLGFGPQEVSRVVGVVKAYTTRVGSRPFPTELLGETGKRIQEAGGEYGTTTGRPRRCGWLDLTIVRYAARLSGLTELVLTKLDVLSGFKPLKVASAYASEEGETRYFPTEYGAGRLADWSPVYQEAAGWDDDLTGIRKSEDLPPNAQTYISRIEQEVGLPIVLIGVGPDREQSISEL